MARKFLNGVQSYYNDSNYTLLGYDSLDVVGGDLILKRAGNEMIRIGADSVGYKGHILPDADSTYNLGNNAKRWASIYTDAISALSNVSIGGALNLNSNIGVLNKAQTAYINLAARDTSGSEVVYDLTNLGDVTISGSTSVGELVTTNHIYGRYVNNSYSFLYRFGGLFLTWDSDSYGTNFHHSITSTDNGTYSDSITINSYDKVRINIDSNNNDSLSTFSVGQHGTGTSGTLLTLDGDGHLNITGHLKLNTGKAFRLYNAAGNGWGEITLEETANKIQFNRGIQPSGDNQSDQLLGTSSKRWYQVHAGSFHGDGSNLTGITSTDSTKMPLAGGTFTGDVQFNGDNYHLMWDKSENRLEFWDNAKLSFGDPGGTPDTIIHSDGSDTIMTVRSGSSFLIGTNGGTPHDNSGKADFVVDVNSSPQISLYSNQVQVGGTDMNWQAKLLYDGSTKLAAWDNDLYLFTQGSSGATEKSVWIRPQGTDGAITTRARFMGDTGIYLYGPIYHMSDGSNADGAELRLIHANNNTTDTIATIYFGNNADNTLSAIVSETNGANNTSNLKFRTSNGGSIGTALTLNADNSATFASDVATGGELQLNSGAQIDWANGDARIVEGDTNNYSLSFQTYDGSSCNTALRLDGDNTATFTGQIRITADIGRDDHNRIMFSTDDSIIFRVADTHRARFDSDALKPYADSSYDLGTNTVRFANIYADTLYGDGSNLTGIIDGSGTAGRIPKFSDSNTLADSRIFESTTGTYIHDSDSTTPLQVTKGGTTFVKFVGLSTINNSYIEIPPGTEAIPAINFGRRHSTGAVDTDTGIYSSAANHIEIATGGSKALGINSSQNATFAGNVTIDKADPTLTLESNRTTIASGNTEILGQIDFKTNEGSFLNGPAVSARIRVDETEYAATTMSFWTSTNPDDTLVKQLEINPSGLATFTGNVTVTGDFQVNGTTTTVNATNLDLSDNIL